MKNIYLCILLLYYSGFAFSQNGLENIIVEKYYISNAADSIGSIGNLPSGSVTYRIFVDMLPGYKFQAAYGVAGHELRLETTTSFFNNEDRGGTTATYSKVNAKNNTVMLDSWFSVGGACTGNFGILKSEDNVVTGGATVINNSVPPILQNADPAAGIPLTVQDGLFAGAPMAVTFVGINSTALSPFNATSQLGNLLTITDGSWASLSGSTGPIPATNRVLIAQMTTNGAFHYELNIQIGTPTGGTENYVAINPTGNEILFPALKGTLGGANIPPTVNITSPLEGASFTTGTIVGITATASDPDGSVASVEFFVDGNTIGIDNSAPFNANYTIISGSHTITAVATDNLGSSNTSSPITINVSINPPPIINITSPSNGSLFIAPSTVTINADASDPNGTVSLVQFYVNGNLVGSDASAPYSFNWTSIIGTAVLTAKATDNLGAQSTSTSVSIIIADPNIPYKILSSTNNCLENSFCLPIIAIDTVDNIIGFDMVLHYNKIKTRPTGLIIVNNMFINPAYVDVASNIDSVGGLINISLYFNNNAPANAVFKGLGNMICVEFAKTINFNSTDTASFTIPFIQESYINGVISKLVDAGKYISFKDSTFNGSLKFWFNNSPIKYNAASPGTYLITNIFGNNNSCSNKSAISVHPDTTGKFKYSILNGQNINIEKDILGTTSVQPVINGFDALLTRKILINDRSFIPNVFQMIAMDVNMDGVVSAGDASQINQRAVLMIPEFKQAWNYDSTGVSNGQLSKDWLFIDSTKITTNLAYRISTTFPLDNGIGFSKARVPVVPFCLPLTISNFSSCPQITVETFKGILLGDIDGNFSTVSPNNLFKQNGTEKIVFDLSPSLIHDGYIDIPVSVIGNQNINSLDFSLSFNESELTFNSIVNLNNYILSTSNINSNDRIFRFTSNSFTNYELNKPLISVRFNLNSNKFSIDDLNLLEGYLNGNRVNIDVVNSDLNMITENNKNSIKINVYPNPSIGTINVIVSENADIQLLDINDRQVYFRPDIFPNQMLEINTGNLANGIYLMKVYSKDYIAMKKIIIQN